MQVLQRSTTVASTAAFLIVGAAQVSTHSKAIAGQPSVREVAVILWQKNAAQLTIVCRKLCSQSILQGLL